MAVLRSLSGGNPALPRSLQDCFQATGTFRSRKPDPLCRLFVRGTSCLCAGLSCDCSADQESLYADSRVRNILYGEGELWKEHTIYGENVRIVK